jgi:Icc protein
MKQDCLRILQVTDSHLFKTENGKLLGMNTQESLDAVMALIRKEQSAPYDCILATGDLAQDGSIEAYQRVKQALSGFDCPQYWIPGNHDLRANMEQVAGLESMPSRVEFEHWQILLLDSQVPGKVHGNLSDDQLAIIDDALAQSPNKHTLVCLHHQPWPMNCKWLDQQQVRSHASFNQRIAQADSIKGVLWGHVHQASDQDREGTRYLSSPSTCVQFEPNSEDFSVDTLAPGYRWLELYPDGRIVTQVSRVENIAFEIDWTVKGY